MPKVFRSWLALLLGLLALAATLPAGARAASAPRRGGILNVALQSDIVTLDPALSSAYVDRQVMINIYDTLVQWTPQGTIAPDLAASWSVSKDGLTYTLQLRKGVRFQDGTPFNAQAVVFNLDRDLNPATHSPRRSELALVSSVEATGPYTVVIHLKSPFSPLLGVLADRAGMMVSPAAVKRWGSQYAQHPVGTGPFEFVSWVKADRIVLKANPHYWVKGEPYLKGIVYHPITDPTVELSALETGQVQMIDGVPPQDAAQVRADRRFVYEQLPGLGYTYIELNTKTPPFNNVFLRRALQYAINRQAINKVVFYGLDTPATSQFPPSSWAYDPKLQIPYSPAIAKGLLADGGQPGGFAFTIYGDNDPVTTEELQAIQSELQQVGIQMNIQLLDFGTLLQHDLSGNYQALLIAWSGRFDPDQNSYAFDVTGGPYNTGGYSDGLVDHYLNLARVATAIPARQKDYWQVAEILFQDSPYVFLEFPPDIKVLDPKVRGFVHFPDGLMRLGQVWLNG